MTASMLVAAAGLLFVLAMFVGVWVWAERGLKRDRK